MDGYRTYGLCPPYRSCPFCGSQADVKKTPLGVTMFVCRNVGCGAMVSFEGDYKVNEFTTEAEDVFGHWNRRTK